LTPLFFKTKTSGLTGYIRNKLVEEVDHDYEAGCDPHIGRSGKILNSKRQDGINSHYSSGNQVVQKGKMKRSKLYFSVFKI
jgi:hypothetical protein